MRRRIFRLSTEVSLRLAPVLLLTAAVRADDAQPSLESALKQAQQRHAPVLVAFHAPWCYSCYYMSRNVLTGRDWDRVQRRAVVLDVDADAPEGTELKERLAVKALPSYVALDAQGRELGRVLGEQTRDEFYRQVGHLLDADDPVESLKGAATGGSAAAVRAAVEVFKAYHARQDAKSGLAWWNSLDPKARDVLLTNDGVKLWERRLELQAASQSKDAPRCLEVAYTVLDGELGCDRYYELDTALSCTAALPLEQKKSLLWPQKKAMDRLLAHDVLVARPNCADARSAVLAAADLDQVLDDAAGESAVLERAIKDVRKRLGAPKELDLKKDRNLADNLRVFLDRAGRTAELDALYPQLIAAYPDDYVYPYRFGKSLAARGRDEDALPWLEQAAAKAYGINRINVAQLRAETLLKLGRADEARAVVGETLQANGPWFPEQAAKLRAVVAAN